MHKETSSLSDTHRTCLEIYTIGHSNVPAEQIVERLRSHAIREVVDVRTLPYSQYTPWFNRDVFERTLQEAGIVYRFGGEYLGGRPDNPKYYRRETLPSGKTNYLKEVDYDAYAKDAKFQKGIARLLDVAEKHPTAIMCSEEDPERCHRHHLIAQTLLRMGMVVRHIRGDGSLLMATLEAKQQSLF